MAWRVKWGPEVPTLLEIQRSTGTTPIALRDRPILSERWAFTDEVFTELTGSRNYTAGGPANIPFNQFYLWAKAHRFTLTELTEVWKDLREFDNAWLEALNKKRELDKANQKGSQ